MVLQRILSTNGETQCIMPTPDSGAVLLQRVDQKIRFIERVNQIIADPRNQTGMTRR